MPTRRTTGRSPVPPWRRTPRRESKAPATTERDLADGTPGSRSGPGPDAPTARRARPRRRRILRFLALGIAILVVLSVGGFLVYAQPQPLLPEATAALTSDAEVAVSTVGRDLVFRPTRARPTVGLVLYPGGKVPPAAYAPTAHRLAAVSGALVTIVDVPFNLAVFDIDAANRVLAREPSIRTWAVGGHSLGGAMAAQFVGSHPGAVAGLVLWASYAAVDLATADLAALSIYGTLDAGGPTFRAEANIAKLPVTTSYVEISGGNHEQMGWYTGQPNDPPATISRVEQQNQVVIATASFLTALGVAPGG